MEKINKYLKGINPRQYQKDIYNTCKQNNCLVVLPTGIGKTLLGVMLAIDRICQYPDSKVLLVAPTRPLAEQHFNTFKQHLPDLFASMELFTGKIRPKKRQELWKKNDIIFSTPQCIANDLGKERYSLKNVSLLIEDECHRCVKDYSYTKIVRKYKQQAKNQRIIGLTASPGSKRKRLKKICKNLDIEVIEHRTRESEDVKKYIKERKFETVKVGFPKEFEEIKELLKEVYDKKVKELKNRKLLFGRATKKNLLQVQKRVMSAISSGNKHYNLLAGASACSMAIKLNHSLELLETQTLHALKSYLNKLFSEAKKKKSKSVQKLVKKEPFKKAYGKVMELINNGEEHPKIQEVKKLLKNEINKNSKFMVFCQLRDTATKLNQELNKIEGINSEIFVGQAKKGEGKNKTGLSQKEQQELLKEFGEGKVNTLVSTSVGEEGLDISEMDHVIFYEPIPSAIRTIQRRGRTARLRPGKITFLITKGTRDEGYYWSSYHKEKKMHKALDKVKKKLEKGELEGKQKTL